MQKLRVKQTKVKKNKKSRTGFCLAEAGHHLWGSFDEGEGRVPVALHRHHAHPLQGRGEGKPLDDGHGLTGTLTINIMGGWGGIERW